MEQIYDQVKGEFVDSPIKMQKFLKEIDDISKKYNLSISHEDGQGSFIVEEYKDKNISWLKAAQKNYK